MMTPTPALTLLHVVVSLIGIGSGFVVAIGLLKNTRLDGWTSVFLATTVATSVTGFLFFPLEPFLPSHAVGIVSLVLLSLAVWAWYFHRVAGGWRRTYVISALTAQYLNVFVLVVQLFRHVPALKALAPTQAEPPFAAAQLVVLALSILLTTLAVRRFHDQPLAAR